MLYIGIDVHTRNHEAVILDTLGKPRGKSFRMGNNQQDYGRFLEHLEKLNPDGEALRVGMEATGHYWLALHSHLQAAGHEVVILNPLRTHAYRARSVRRVKNDRIDARCIAEVIRTHATSGLLSDGRGDAGSAPVNALTR